MLTGRSILLIIGGGIAAYKSLELIRRLQDAGMAVTPVLTRAALEFVTPLSVSALAGRKVYQDLFDLTDEAEMGHIQLSRAADLVVVAPATADLMAKMAGGHANDLASTLLMATDKPVLIAPAMNVRMWTHPATQRNLATLRGDGVQVVGPDDGAMACGEFGPGRMSEPPQIVHAVVEALQTLPVQVKATMAADQPPLPLAGRHLLVTSGPTHEPIDPVRYIANRSSGAQGTAIANALVALGARVTFVTGPAAVARPRGAEVIEVETAAQMATATLAALPADAVVCAAAVADWHVVGAGTSKIKKGPDGAPPALQFAENTDILRAISQHPTQRPPLVIGFAAETDDVIAHATAKRARKGCDWIVANDVRPETGIMGGSRTTVTVIRDSGAEAWPEMTKAEAAARLATDIAAHLNTPGPVTGSATA